MRPDIGARRYELGNRPQRCAEVLLARRHHMTRRVKVTGQSGEIVSQFWQAVFFPVVAVCPCLHDVVHGDSKTTTARQKAIYLRIDRSMVKGIWRGDDNPPAGAKDAIDLLPERNWIEGNMLDDLAKKHEIDAVVRKNKEAITSFHAAHGQQPGSHALSRSDNARMLDQGRSINAGHPVPRPCIKKCVVQPVASDIEDIESGPLADRGHGKFISILKSAPVRLKIAGVGVPAVCEPFQGLFGGKITGRRMTGHEIKPDLRVKIKIRDLQFQSMPFCQDSFCTGLTPERRHACSFPSFCAPESIRETRSSDEVTRTGAIFSAIVHSPSF